MRIRLSYYRLRRSHVRLCRFIGAAMHAPSHRQLQAGMFAGGLLLLLLGLNGESFARPILVNQERFCEATNAVLTYVEGSFGALVLVAAGVGAIMSAAFGQYRAALGLMVVSIGSFILRSLLGTFFNDQCIRK